MSMHNAQAKARYSVLKPALRARRTSKGQLYEKIPSHIDSPAKPGRDSRSSISCIIWNRSESLVESLSSMIAFPNNVRLICNNKIRSVLTFRSTKKQGKTNSSQVGIP